MTKIINNYEDSLMFIFYLLGRLAEYGDNADPEEIIEHFLDSNPDIKERVYK